MNRKILFLVFFILKIIKLYSQELSQIPFSNSKYTISRIDEKEFVDNKIKYKDGFVVDSLFSPKVNEITSIKTSLKSINFKDKAHVSDPSFEEYKCIGLFPKIGKYVLKFSQYEFSSYLIIDYKTGSIDTLFSRPHLSPNCKYLVSYDFDPYGDFMQSNIQVYFAKVGGLKSVFDISVVSWVAIDLFWKTDNMILVKVATMEDYLMKRNNFSFLKIFLK